MIEHPSPNQAPRANGTAVQHLVLHYTETDLAGALDILTDERRPIRVSSHYVLAQDGTVYRLVPEDRVAWHAGRSHWRGREGLNATSIGIEIVNLHGDRHDYPGRQIDALVELCRGILGRHSAIEPRNVVGHSDIAPLRKIDPGLRFPWQHLAAEGIGLWPRAAATTAMPEKMFLQRLALFGYAPPHDYVDAEGTRVIVGAHELTAAFQRRFRTARVDGIADAGTRARLADLLDQVGNLA
jgi:N-acetylmuramoyl-L-alanine amidase